jgi:predicted RNA-binding Zn ribbon-like protein
VAAEIEDFRFRQGAGRLCLDFIRTLRHRGHDDAADELTGPAALSAWISQCGPVPAPIPLPETDMDQVRALREAVFVLLTRGAGGNSASERDLINQAAGAPGPVPRLEADASLTWQAADPVAATLSLVARDALDLIASPAAGRIRECANPGCSALFLDVSRPGSRRWCAMSSCGNRAKKSTYRERHATG